MRGTHRNTLIGIFTYLQDEYRFKHGGAEMPDVEEWRLFESTPHAPGQTNGNDCGVFVCMYADYISNGWPLVFNQSHINQCRERIALGILQNCAVTTKALSMVLDEIWNMRDLIIYAVQMYREPFLEYLKSGKVPRGDDSLSLFLSSPTTPEYGKLANRIETFEKSRLGSLKRKGKRDEEARVKRHKQIEEQKLLEEQIRQEAAFGLASCSLLANKAEDDRANQLAADQDAADLANKPTDDLATDNQASQVAEDICDKASDELAKKKANVHTSKSTASKATKMSAAAAIASKETGAAKIGSAGELLLEDLSLFGVQENFNDYINK